MRREAGLAEVEADAYFPVTSPACAVLEDATVWQIRHLLVGQGLATAPMLSAWGRKP